MKHIKLFENYNNPLYWQIGEINQDERKEEKFDQRYFNEIENRLKEGFSIRRMGGGGWCRITYLVCLPNCPACEGRPGIHSPQTDFYVDIFQMEDLYFDLEYLDAISPDYLKYRFNSEYYRCDDFDGLIKFLEDEKIIDKL